MKSNQNETLARLIPRWLFWENVLLISSVAILFFFTSLGRADSSQPDAKISSTQSQLTKSIPLNSTVVESEIKMETVGPLSRVRHVLIGEELVRVEDEVSPQASSVARLMDYSRFRVHMKAGSAAFSKLIAVVSHLGASVIPTDCPEVFLISYKEKSLSLQESLRTKLKKSAGVVRLESLAKST